MNGISGFLQKFLNLAKDNNIKLLLILESIKTESGIELKKEDLDIKGDNIRLVCNPVVRNEIFMRKSKIEDRLKSQNIFLNII